MTGRAGYSLVEVLIAFVIMTLVLSALIPGQAALLGRTTVLEDRVSAHDYALSRLARLGFDMPLATGLTENTYRGWQVRTQITPGDPLSGEINTLIVDLTILDTTGQELATAETIRAGQ